MHPIGTPCWIVIPSHKEARQFTVVRHLQGGYMVMNEHKNIAMQVADLHLTKEGAERECITIQSK
jgi:hypothetical protein